MVVEGLDIALVELYDMAGKRVSDLAVDADRIDLPISGMASGLYILKTTNKAGKLQTVKVSL